MNGKKDISTFNSRIIIRQWNIVTDTGGGSYYNQANSWTVWAAVSSLTGSQGNTEAVQQWAYSTTFTIRYNEDFKNNMTVDDEDGYRWLINSIDVSGTNQNWFMQLRCSRTDINIDVS